MKTSSIIILILCVTGIVVLTKIQKRPNTQTTTESVLAEEALQTDQNDEEKIDTEAGNKIVE